MRKKIVTIPALVMGGVLAVAGCGTATQEQKYEHLRSVADKGADAHFVLVNENKETTREVCEQHYDLFTDGVPQDTPTGPSMEWRQLSKDYFVDSCVKGEPRVIQTRSTTPSSTTPSSTTPSSVPASADAVAPEAASVAGS